MDNCGIHGQAAFLMNLTTSCLLYSILETLIKGQDGICCGLLLGAGLSPTCQAIFPKLLSGLGLIKLPNQ